MVRLSETLTDHWKGAGIEAGDTVLIHSRVGPTLKRFSKAASLTPEVVLQSFLDALGPEGTLLLPLFNFGFCRGEPFDIRKTPSHMGMLTEAGRLFPGSVRTGHPVYSFAVIGKHQDRFANVVNKSAYGPDSPFAMLHQMDGKIGVLDLPDQNSMTFYHYVEECLNVPSRYLKDFTGAYTDSSGHTTQRTFQIYVRDLEKGVETHVDPMGELLWKQGCYRGDRPLEGCGFRTIRAAAVFDKTAEVIRAGKAEGMLYQLAKREAS